MKKIITLLLCVVMLAVGVNAAFEKVNTYSNNFSDVTEQNWFYENVKTSYELGFMNGKEEGKFDPSGSVTVVEGITLASRLHAAYNDTEVQERAVNNTELRFDCDDDTMVDTTGGRNNRAQFGITFGRGIGEFDEGVLRITADDPNAGGAYDPQIMFNKFNLDSRDYDTMKIRMRVVERLPELVEGVPEKRWVQFYFATSTAPGYGSDKLVMATWPEEADESEWFELTLELGKHPAWKDIVTNFRLDPPENNGVYEFDYIVLSKNQENKTAKWYDKYIDYAIKNNIMDDSQYYADDYNKNITRAQLCEMIARAIPEKEFNAINDVKGIPDVLRDSKNSDVYLTLYKAGILLGDTEGKFNADSDIKRSEVAAIINRVALPENRVKGTVNADWEAQGNEYDIEFNDDSWLQKLKFESNGTEIKDGALIFQALDKGEGAPSRYDSKITFPELNLNASENTKLRIRFKATFDEDAVEGNKLFDFYFATDEDPTFTESKSIHADMIASSYKDAAGWYILEVDLATKAQWKGHVVSYRFDPTNANGDFVIDYIRFVRADPLLDASHETLLGMGYTATGLLRDPDFENGFHVAINDNSLGKDPETHGTWNEYSTTGEKPVWHIGPFFTRLDLWTDRDTTTDKYTLTDKEGISTVKYNPEEKSSTLRLNGAQNYQGKPHIDGESAGGWWPHLLLDQTYTKFPKELRERNGADADRIYMELDVRVLDFKDNPVMEGHHSLTFPIFFYLLCDDAPGGKIWFGGGAVIHSNPNPSLQPAWGTDSAAHQYMYGVPMADVYDGMENSYNPEPGVYLSSNEWKHLRVDLTPHLDRCIEWANRDNAYGVKVSRENLYFAGANIGFEIFGNYDATVEFKNFDLISYRKG